MRKGQSLVERYNAVARFHRSALRVGLLAPGTGVALPGKKLLFACEPAICGGAGKLTEAIIIVFNEHHK